MSKLPFHFLTASERAALSRCLTLVDLDKKRFAASVVAGVAALGSAIGLAAVSAWLIARASQMPPVLRLSVAATSVRAFGIGKAIFRYIERLISHRTALRGMAALRTRMYQLLAVGRPDALSHLRRGDLLTRTGQDVDAIGDLVVRALLPAWVAFFASLLSVGIVGILLPAAGVALALCLAIAGIVGPWFAAKSARYSEIAHLTAQTDMSANVLTTLDNSSEIAVSGTAEVLRGERMEIEKKIAQAKDASAKPAALGAGIDTLALALAVMAALVFGLPATVAGTLAPTELAVVVLTPLAAFEATAQLGPAARQAVRSALAAERVAELLDAAASETPPQAPESAGVNAAVGRVSGTNSASEDTRRWEDSIARYAASEEAETPLAGIADMPVTWERSSGRTSAQEIADVPVAPPVALAQPGEDVTLRTRGLAVAWPAGPTICQGLDLDLSPGRAIAIVGPSGIGKTTVLNTLAGLLEPRAGTAEIIIGEAGSADARHFPTWGSPREMVSTAVIMTAEDAHVFATTVLENLRVARGDLTREQAHQLLSATGLDQWVAELPDGLDTLLGSDGETVSGGERRRLLLARALASPAPLLLLDEPGEHLDPATADRLVGDLLTSASAAGRGILLVTHRLAPLNLADEVIVIDHRDDGPAHVVARGTHAHLCATLDSYRWAAEEEGLSGA